MIIKRVEVWRAWWPFVFVNEFTAVGGKKVLANFAVLLKMKPDGRTDLQSSMILGSQGIF